MVGVLGRDFLTVGRGADDDSGEVEVSTRMVGEGLTIACGAAGEGKGCAGALGGDEMGLDEGSPLVECLGKAASATA